MANKDFGYVWEGEAQGVSLISNISFDGASSVNDVDAVAYGFDAEGNATKDTTAISAGKLTYSSTTGTFSCECPFTDCVSWKLFIWRRNVALSVSDVSWSSGQTIPVSAIVTELNLLRQRVEDMTTNVGRGVRVPEQGNNETTILPPLESRSGQVSGYDASGRPAVGKDVPEVAALYSARDEAVTAAEGAKASELSAGQFANEAGIHSSDASESLAGAVSAANEAATYATRASTSASTAKNEADRAEAAKENIEEYEQKSAASATAAASSASEAATYAGQAKSYQSIASSNANAAGQYASNASTSASSAASFANVAGDKASAASSSAKAAAQSETNAANSANAAALSARESEAAADSAASEAVAAASASASAAAIAQEAAVSATAAAESAEQAAQSAEQAEETLQNVYTKTEVDSALAVRDTGIATNTANIDWLTTAVDGDWKTYMLGRAAQTGVQKNINIVNRAIKEYNTDNTSALAGRLIEDWQNLYVGYEVWLASVGEESPLDAGFWVAYFEALAQWEADSTAIEWSVTDNGDGTYSSNCPYFEAVPECVVDLNVTSATGLSGRSLFSGRASRIVVYLPSAETSSRLFGNAPTTSICHIAPSLASAQNLWNGLGVSNMSVFAPRVENSTYALSSNNYMRRAVFYIDSASVGNLFGYITAPVERLTSAKVFVANATSVSLAITYSPSINSLLLYGGIPLATSINSLIDSRNSTATALTLSFGDEWEGDIVFPSATTAVSFAKNRGGFNQAVLLPVLTDGTDAFLNAGLSAENISKTLNSLPEWTDGASHVVTFTGCPGAAELTQESESVAAAVARGWVVEL